MAGSILEKLSDSDLEAVSKGDLHSVSDEGLHLIAQGDAIRNAENLVTPQNFNPLGTKVGSAIDSVTGAPTRAGIYAAQNSDVPTDILTDFGKGFHSQFAEDPSKAPSGEMIVEKAGVPHGLASKVLGVGMDMAANTLNLVAPAAGAINKAVPAAAEAASELFSGRAGARAAQAMGIDKSTAKLLLSKYGPDAVKDLGNVALQENLVGPLSTPEHIAERAAAVKEEVGQKIGTLLDEADHNGAPRINAKEIALRLSQDPEIAQLNQIPGMEGVSERVLKQLDTLARNGESMSLREAQKLRQGVDKSINFSKSSDDLRGLQSYLYKIRDELANGMNQAVNAYQGNNADALRLTNRKWSALERIEDIATNRSSGNAANKSIGLTDTIAGSGGASVGSKIGLAMGGPTGATVGAGAGALVGGGINKFGRTYGPALSANTYDALANALANKATEYQAGGGVLPVFGGLSAAGATTAAQRRMGTLVPQMAQQGSSNRKTGSVKK